MEARPMVPDPDEILALGGEREILARLAALHGEAAGDAGLALLGHTSPRVVAAAVRMVGVPGLRRAVPPLRVFLNPTTAPEIAREAMRSLARIGTEEAHRALAGIVADPGDPLHRPALEVLAEVETGPLMVAPLRTNLLAPGYPFKTRILEVLARFRGPSVEALFQEFLDQPDEALATAAARGLARFPSPDNYRRLSDRMALGPWTVEAACLESMVAIEPRPALSDLAPALASEHPEVALQALAILGRKVGPEALPHLENLTRSPSWKIRGEAARLLGTSGDPRAIRPLEALLVDERPVVRAAAFKAGMGLPGLDHAAWGARAATDAEPEVRATAPGHLAECRSNAHRSRLAGLARDPAPEVRREALGALAGFDLRGLEAELLPLAEDPVPEVRALARELLPATGAPPSALRLEKALEKLDAGDREGAREDLRRLATATPGDARILYELARACRLSGDLAEAEVYLVKVVAEAPDHLGAWKQLAEVRLETGRKAEAVPALKEACGLDRGNWKLWSAYGELLFAEGHARAAAGALEEALRIHHGHEPAHRTLARAYQASGHPDGAEREWRILHEKNPMDPEPLASLGSLSLARGEVQAAASFLARARDLGDDRVELQRELATALTRLGDQEAARVLWEELVTRGDARAEDRLALARARLATGDHPAALALARALGREVTPSPDAFDLEADALEALGEPEAALDARVRLAGIAPQHPGSRRKLAALLAKTGRSDQARHAMTEELGRDPLDLELRHALLELEIAANRSGAAIQILQKGIELHPREVAFHARLSRILHRRGDLAGAVARIQAAIELEPDQPAHRVFLGELYQELGSPASARENYEAALARGETRAEIRFRVGRMLLESGEPARALLELERIAETEIADPTELALARGTALFRLGRFDRARSALARAADHPVRPEPHALLAWIETEHGDPREGLAHLRELQRRAPAHPEIPLLEGLVRRRLGETHAAAAALERALVSRPGDPRLVAELAACWFEQGEYRKVVDTWPGSPFLPGTDPVLRVAKAEAHARLGNHAKASELATAMLEVEPDNLPALAVLARSKRTLGDLTAAEVAAHRGLRIDPDHLELLRERAELHLARRYFDAALADAAHGLELPGREPVFFRIQAAAHLGSGRPEAALSALSGYLVREPRDAEGHLLMAQALSATGRRSEAAESLGNALELDPTREPAYLELAEIHIAEGRPKEAARILERYLEISTRRAPALRSLAKLHEAQGDLTAAARRIGELVECEDGEEARTQLVDLLLRRRDMGAAWPMLERSADVFPGMPLKLARQKLEGGDPQLARDLLGLALSRNPHDLEAQLQMGICHFRLGSYPASRRMLEKVLDQVAGHPVAHFHLGLLGLMEGSQAAARPHLEAAVRGDPSNQVARRHLARIELAEGNHDQALAWAKDGLTREATDRELLLVAAAANEAVGREDAALMAYREAARLGCDERSHPPGMRLALRRGNPKIARELGEAYLAARPEDDAGYRLLAKAAAADGDPARSVEVLSALREIGAASAADLREFARAASACTRFDEAADALERCLELEPGSDETWVLLGHIEIARGRVPDASHAYRRATEQKPDRADAWRGLAETAHAMERTREALDACETAARLRPADPRIHLLLGRTRLAAGAPAKAREALETALGVKPDANLAGEIRVELARVLRKLGEPGNARRLLEAVPRSMGRSAARELVEIAFEAGDHAAAVHHAKGYLASWPEEPAILETLGRSLLAAGMDRQARTCLDRHLAIFGTPEALAEELARARLEKGQAGDALQVLVAAMEKAPRSARLWMTMADARAAKGDAAGSITALERAADLDPGRVDAARRLGAAYLEAGQWDKARAVYQDASKANPYLSDLQLGLGRALSGQGETEAARSAFERAVELEPGSGDAQRELGLLFARVGLRARAIECLKRAVQVDPGDLPALHTLARAYRDLGEKHLAEACFERLLQLAPPRSNESKAARAYLAANGQAA